MPHLQGLKTEELRLPLEYAHVKVEEMKTLTIPFHCNDREVTG